MGYGSELSLDFKPSSTPKRISEFLRDVSLIGDRKKRLSKLEEYANCLEEEQRKIDAFKRELPLCMLLLNDAIEIVREECRKPVLEEFMPPMKSKFDEDGEVKMEKDSRDKMNWMSSAQLWSDNYNNNDNNGYKNNEALDVKQQKDKESDGTAYEYSFPCKYRNGGGSSTLFKGFLSFPLRKEEKEAVLPLPDLSLLSPGIKNSGAESVANGLNSKSSIKALGSSSASAQSNSLPQSRKSRRCWSPELHRRFVNALQQIGGSQVATPKQIRELMKVDGLTNDEVKSHLQKYRLHTRRLPSASSPLSNQQVVVLGGMWVPNDHYQDSKQSNSQSSSPQGPLRSAGIAQGISTTLSDSCEEDDGKSDSYSWKGHHQRSRNEETE